MTPKPKEYSDTLHHTSNGSYIKDDIVISGMAGLYPNSHDVKELSDILYKKVNPVETTDRWSFNLPEISQYAGTIPDLQYFDAQFFKVHHRLSHLMDPMSRKLLEQTYQAIFDAGYSPEHLSGKRIGVFVGNCYSETEKAFFYMLNSKSGLGIAGCNRSMFSNRISYYLNLKGPSMSVDMSCSSSAAALEMAYDAIARGECEAAIVGGANLCLHPQTSIHYGRVVDICKDGKTKCFDANADGFCKSEAVNVLFLQKKKDALRVYARVVQVKSEFMTLPQSEIGAVCGFRRDPADITRFLEKFYQRANVSPKDVQYVEAFGSSTKDGDKSELIAIDEFFCKGRGKPLMVGSIMSNIGYVEAASGLASVTKVLLAYNNGKLAANLHYNTPRDDIDAIREGRIEILKDHKEFISTYTAINNISMTGVFSHVLLSGYNKKKDIARYKSNFPRIVLGSGRQETSVQQIFNYLKSKPIDPEELAILHHFHEKKVNGHLGRGFIILDTNKNNETVSLIEECAYFDQAKRPLWFVYSGMGSQWAGMGKDLMRIPVFAAAIERCHRVLEPKGVNVIEIITSNDKKILDNIMHSFVGISAIQIGLTDVLRAMDIVPDTIIGHSMGEIGCAYADGCFTAEEAILCAYSRGFVSIQTPFIRGSMAAVGLGYKEISKMCPPEIEVACHNSAESCTISGPAEIMKEFVLRLTNQGIFAKEVPCSNIPYHSKYIADAGPALLKYMQDLILTPRPRSARWLSTSVPQDRWDEPIAKYSSAEYHTNNLLSPVLFEETSQLIPPDAVILEVAPHALLQAILKRSLPSTCKLLPLTRRGHPDITRCLLEATGRLFMEGFNPKVRGIYPEVEFPVSTTTPMLSHLVDWVYQEKWSLHKPTAANKRIATTSYDVISTYDVEHSHLKGHVIRGKIQYPFSAVLVAVWDTMAASLNVKPRELSVQFENLHFYIQPILHKKHQLRPFIAIQKGSGRFEVLDGNSIIMTGTIIPEIKSDREVHDAPTTITTNISANTIYELLHAKDYNYINDFRSIHSANESLTEAKIKWKDNWVTYLDGIIQLNVLRRKHHTVSKLNLIRKIVIDIKKHRDSIIFEADKCLVNAQVLDLYDLTVCGGVVMETVKFADLPLLKNDNIELKTCEFVPLFSDNKINETHALHMFLQIIADNVKTKEKIRIVEISDTYNFKSGFINIEEIINTTPCIKATYTKINIDEKYENFFENVDLLLITDLTSNNETFEKLKTFLHQDTFIIHKQQLMGLKDSSLYTVLSSHVIENGKVVLAIWRPTECNPAKSLVVRIPKGHTSRDKVGGEYYLPLEDKINPEQGATLKLTHIGDLDSLYWVNEGLQYKGLCGVEVKVNYIGVNIVYVNKLLGTQRQNVNEPTKSVIDFSGYSKSGTRVMGIINSDTVSSLLNANPELLLSVPEHWTLEDAATVPLAYSMAFYILFIKVKIRSKHVICVQGAAGALGQAIISVALAHGCEVFATVSSNSKKQYLRKMFPDLKDDHIIDHSRDLNFVYDIQRTTNGKGCNLLVSCATDELKNFSFRCLGSYGVMIDTNVVPNQENYNFGMDHLSLDKVYYPTDFSTIFQPKFAEDIKLIRLLMIDGIRRGYVRPLTRVTYQAQDAARAFHLQAAGNNRGRVLLDLRQLKLNIIPRVTCSSSSWQLIVSDNEKLALKLTERLINRGAKKFYMLVDNISSFVNIQIRRWEDDGVIIKLKEAFRNPSDYSNLIKHCKNDGLQLESVFIITSNEKAPDVIETINNFAATISKYNYSLRYFALVTTSGVNINSGSWFGTNGHSMMVTKIKLPEIVVMQNNQRPISLINAVSMNDAMDALERALCSQKKIVLAHKSNVPRKTLLHQIMSLADTDLRSKSKNICAEFTLNELNMDNSKLLAIQSFLRDEYEVNLNVEDLKKLSVKSINELESRCIEFDFEENQGIALYFPTLYTDELLYTADMLYMSTLALSATSFSDIDLSKPYLCIVPGVEGYYERFTELGERLKLPAIALQPGLDHPNETIPELAQRYVNVMKKKAALNNNFYLLGYESGIFVALEMAAILEKNGLTGTVFCIGGTPTELIKDFQYNLKCYNTKDQLQMAVLKNAYSLITKADPNVLDQFCKNMEWANKLDVCMDMLLGQFPHSIQYTRKWIDYVYTKLLSLLENNYKPKRILSQIISLRPSYKYSSNVDMSLQNYSDKEVITYQLESPLSCAPQDMICASIINSHLDSETLETFNKRSICQSYAIVTENDTL